jgi:aminopeptidase N
MIARYFTLVAALVTLSAASGVRADTYPRNTSIDALHYTFHITLSDDTDDITGETTIDVRYLSGGVASFELDLAGRGVDGKGMTVTSVVSDGRPLQYQHQRDRLRLVLPAPANAGERRQYTIAYHGVPGAGLRIGRNKYGERTFFSSNWPDNARRWLPMIDHPYDKATSEFIVTAPARYQTVANGLLVEEQDLGDGTRVTHWKESVPIASWLNNIGVAQFASHHAGLVKGVELQTWAFHQDRDAGIATFETPARQALEFYSEYIGPYAYEKLASVQAAGVGGGMEHASIVFYGENTVSGRPASGLVAHEVAHQWFGDSVTERDWDDAWLSEGFATYCALLFTEHFEGRDAFVAELKRSQAQIFTTQKANPTIAVVHDNLSDMKKVLNPLIYQKGAWTLHMLRGIIGAEAFQQGLRDYYRRYRDANASTDEFRRAMEETSGTDLAWFFQEWLHQPGWPQLDGGWRYDAAARQIVIDLQQVQPGSVYRMPIEVGVAVDGRATRTERIQVNDRQNRITIASDREPAAVTLDPNTWLLMEATFARRQP